MAEKFTIKEILDYPDKVFTSLSGLNLTGVLRYVGPESHKTGTKDGRDYDFWSQFIVIEDATGKIGADKTGDKESVIPQSAKGKQVVVEGAKTKLYPDKDKKIQRKLTKGKITLKEPESGEAPSGGGKEGYDKLPEGGGRYVVSREEWARKDRIITRIAIVKSLIGAGQRFKPDVVDEAEGWFDWIYYSEDKEPQLGKKETKSGKNSKTKDRSSDKSTVEEVIDKDFDRKKTEIKLLKLYTKGYELKIFNAEYDLSKWMFEQFEKKTVGALTDDQVFEAVKVLGKMVKEKEK